MTTKALFVTALFSLAANSTLLAQSTVKSDNAVGVVQQIYQPGQFQMIANPLNTTNNTLGGLFPSLPNGTVIFKWNGSGYASSSFRFGAWSDPTMTLNPGEGCFIKVGGTTPYTNFWAGEILQGTLTNNFPVGYSIVSSKVPEAGPASSLFPCFTQGTIIYKYNTNTITYDASSFAFGTWHPSQPTIEVGEAVFLSSTSGNNCVRTFSIDN